MLIGQNKSHDYSATLRQRQVKTEMAAQFKLSNRMLWLTSIQND